MKSAFVLRFPPSAVVYLLLAFAIPAITHAAPLNLCTELLSSGQQSLTVLGPLSVQFLDDQNQSLLQSQYFLEDSHTGKVYSVFPHEIPKGIFVGQFVIANVRYDFARNCKVEILPDPDLFQSPVTGSSEGLQNILAILVTYNPNHTIGQAEAQIVRNTLFSPFANQFFQEASYGKVFLTGDVVGPFVLPQPTGCDHRGDAFRADMAAIESGVDIMKYNRKFYVYADRNSGDIVKNQCRWIGLGSFGTLPTTSWIAYHDGGMGLFGHELGHNLGMHHANSDPTVNLDCSVVGIGTMCREQGDSSDLMGNGPMALMNAPHRVQTGWLPDSSLQTISQSGTYRIAPLGLNPNDTGGIPQVLRFQRKNTQDDYYLSYRGAIGLDQNLSSVFKNKLNIHRWFTGFFTQTVLMKNLDRGQSFTDPAGLVTIDEVMEDPAGLKLRVTLGSSCQKSRPMLGFDPGYQTVRRGDRTEVTIILGNRDERLCSRSTFRLDTVLPGGLSGQFSQDTVELAPGGKAFITLALDTSGAEVGSHAFRIQVSGTDQEPSHSAFSFVTVNVADQ